MSSAHVSKGVVLPSGLREIKGRMMNASGPKQTWRTMRCVAYLQPVCPHQLLCGGGSGMRYRDAGVAGDQHGGTGQDVSRHQTGRDGAKVGVKRGGRGGVHVGGEAGRDGEHGLRGEEVLSHTCR